MRLFLRSIAAGVLLLSLPALAHARTRHYAGHASIRHASLKSHHNQRFVARTPSHEADYGMDPDRATQIQSALIKSGYLSGEPSGKWDAESIAAMQKMQSDNGWQTKVTPDSRALIKLGLGPNQHNTQTMASN